MAEIVEKMQMVRVTLQDIWRSGAARLEAAGIEEAGPDAELLLLHVLGKSKAQLLRDWREPWPQSPALQSAWEAMLERRAAGEPVQYVIGEQYFYGRRFIVNPSVLIPRPETELLVEAVLAAADRLRPGAHEAGDSLDAGMPRERSRSSVHERTGSSASERTRSTAQHVLDIGTGSGALAVTLAAERPAWRVTASDLSEEALSVAKQNALNVGVQDRIRFVQGNLLEPFVRGGKCTEPVDILVSNPPYIPSGDLPGLQREVRDFEPRLALDGGDDGLEPYRRMTEQLGLLPALPRIVAWEVGAGQAEPVAHLLRGAADWSDIRFVVDYAGINRHVVAVR